jgi:hypothetical protein
MPCYVIAFSKVSSHDTARTYIGCTTCHTAIHHDQRCVFSLLECTYITATCHYVSDRPSQMCQIKKVPMARIHPSASTQHKSPPKASWRCGPGAPTRLQATAALGPGSTSVTQITSS